MLDFSAAANSVKQDSVKDTNTPKPANKPKKPGPASRSKPPAPARPKPKPASKKKAVPSQSPSQFVSVQSPKKKKLESQQNNEDPFAEIDTSNTKMDDNFDAMINEAPVVIENAEHDIVDANGSYVENGTNETSETIDADSILNSWKNNSDNTDHFSTLVQPVASTNGSFGFGF